jgi:hypothetical protein
MKTLLELRVDDPVADRVIRSHAEAIEELQLLPMASASVVRGVLLPQGVEVTVPHKLGRKPVYVRESTPRGATTAGQVHDLGTKSATTGNHIDRTKVVVLRANGFGSDITVDVLFL